MFDNKYIRNINLLYINKINLKIEYIISNFLIKACFLYYSHSEQQLYLTN